MKGNLKEKNNRGFSLLELVVVIAVLAILSLIGGPYLLNFINRTRFEITKNFMRESFTRCVHEPNVLPLNPNIPGVAFQSSNCSSLMTATIDNSCTISMDMTTGQWATRVDNYDVCLAYSTSTHNSFRPSHDMVVESRNPAARVWNEANWDEEQGCIGGGPGSFQGETQTNYALPEELKGYGWQGIETHQLRHELDRQALSCNPEAHLMEYRDIHNAFPDKHLAIHLDPTEMKRTGNKVCRNNLLQRINCPGSNEFDDEQLKPLAEKHRLEQEQLAAEFLKESEENIEKQFPEIAKARAARREILRERGLLIEKEDIGRTDICRNYWGWSEPCPDSQEAKVHEERMKTDLKYQAEQQDLKKRIDLDTYGEYRLDPNTTDGYHRAQFQRSVRSMDAIRDKYEKAVKDLYQNHQKELDQIRKK